MSDRIFLQLDGKFALGSDELQWILYRNQGASWRGISFVRSRRPSCSAAYANLTRRPNSPLRASGLYDGFKAEPVA